LLILPCKSGSRNFFFQFFEIRENLLLVDHVTASCVAPDLQKLDKKQNCIFGSEKSALEKMSFWILEIFEDCVEARSSLASRFCRARSGGARERIPTKLFEMFCMNRG
jgi:hypothetical protein